MGICVHISIEMTFKLFKSTHNHQMKHLTPAPIFLYFPFFHSANEVLSRHLLYPSYFAIHSDCHSQVHEWST